MTQLFKLVLEVKLEENHLNFLILIDLNYLRVGEQTQNIERQKNLDLRERNQNECGRTGVGVGN